eukprot:m.515937 g.515937  ORF g.515937 m.515937 type:complete len:54 (+) comp57464_c0_seq5:1156-1317(+)
MQLSQLEQQSRPIASLSVQQLQTEHDPRQPGGEAVLLQDTESLESMENAVPRQ